MFVHLFCFFAQKTTRTLQEKEARVIKLTQELKDKKETDESDLTKKADATSKESQELVKRVVNTDIDPNHDDDDMYGKNRAIGKVALAK